MTEQPAILGNNPVFAQKVNIVRPWLPEFAQMADAAEGIVSSGMVTKGQHLRAFEEAVAEHLGVKHAVAVSSCTTGLMLAYHSLALTGDVVVPSFTFMATVSSLVWAGLRPVFADVDVETTNLDPQAAEAAITPDTSALIVVHNFGNPADIAAFEAIARRHQIKLVFDAAHGFGSCYQGAPVGSQGDVQVYSLSPTKLLIAGEGGIIATNNDDLAARARMGREYGNDGAYNSALAGINARMPEMSALLGLHSLPMLEAAVQRRNEVAALYQQELASVPGISFQKVQTGNRNSYKDFCLMVDAEQLGLTRDELAQALLAENIDVRKYYDPPVHRHTAYQHYPTHGELPRTEWLSANILCLPVWSKMSDEIVQQICQAIRRISAHSEPVRGILTGGNLPKQL